VDSAKVSCAAAAYQHPDGEGTLGSQQRKLLIRRPPPLPRLPLPSSTPESQPLLLVRPLGVEDEEAVDDLVLERLQPMALGVRRRRDVRRHLDVRPAVGHEHRAVHVLVETAELGDAGVVAGGVFEEVVGLGEALLGVDLLRNGGNQAPRVRRTE